MQLVIVFAFIFQFLIGNFEAISLMKSKTSKAIQTISANQGSINFNTSADLEDGGLSVPELITKYGYPVETHNITTEDGYILQAHRIPYGKKCGAAEGKEVIWLQHGLLGDSSHWIITGVERGLGYVLADACYDVWLGNARGNTYSKNHVQYSPIDDLAEFWTFSWHEMGAYDLPAAFDYTLNVTGAKNLSYVGHSMGTTMFWVCMSVHPEYNDKIKLMSAFAPVAYMTNIKSPLRFLAPFAGQLEDLLHLVGVYEFLPSAEFTQIIGEKVCDPEKPSHLICSNLLFLICGFDPDQMDAEMLPVFVGHGSGGTSSRALIHYAQLINTTNFRQFDFGIEENQVKYGQETPPDYDLTKITTPVVLFRGDNDWLANVTDVEKLQMKLPNVQDYRMEHDQFNHLDFILAKDLKTLVNDPLMTFLETGKPPSSESPSTTTKKADSSAPRSNGMTLGYVLAIISFLIAML